MLKYVAIILILELAVLGALVGFTKDRFLFHTMPTVTLTEELIKHGSDLSYSQNYEINQPMRYLINIEAEDGSTPATLLWPTEPFGRYLILVPYQSEELKTKQSFQGQLVRCIYKCMPSKMYIEMFGFVEMIEKQFPKLKGKYGQLPAIILDTTATPGGLRAYIFETKYYWMGFSFSLTLCGILILRKALLKDT